LRSETLKYKFAEALAGVVVLLVSPVKLMMKPLELSALDEFESADNPAPKMTLRSRLPARTNALVVKRLNKLLSRLLTRESLDDDSELADPEMTVKEMRILQLLQNKMQITNRKTLADAAVANQSVKMVPKGTPMKSNKNVVLAPNERSLRK